MSPSPHVQALYKRPVILWVEDSITSEYLVVCWQNDPDIGLLIAGGSGNIRSVVNASRLDGHTHVFGFADRDMGNDNVAGWFNVEGNPVFVPTAHEVENYLLQAVSLADCASNTTGRTEAEIEARLQPAPGTWFGTWPASGCWRSCAWRSSTTSLPPPLLRPSTRRSSTSSARCGTRTSRPGPQRSRLPGQYQHD